MENFIRISKGNAKMGGIPSFSLPSGKTCSAEACATCLHKCYAHRIEKLRNTVKNAYEINYAAIENNMELVEKYFMVYFKMPNAPRLFRWHVSGDFYKKEYFGMAVRIAKENPQTKFLAFTKQREVIVSFLVIDEIPENFILVWSAWPGVPVPAEIKKNHLPIAWMQDGTETRIPKDAIQCGGDCEHCGKCWALNGHDVVFNEH